MMNRFKKVLSLLTAIALLLSGALALAEETIEAPVVDSEPVQVEEIAQETAAAQEELPIIEEEIPVQEEATQEEAPAADETPAQEENTVVEETPVQEEAPAAEPESDPVPSYNNNEETPAEETPAEETPAEETPAQEEAPVAGEDPFDGDDADDDESYSEDELVTFDDDNWGYVDPEIVSDYIPEMTAELKFPEITKLSVNEKVAGNIDAENDAQYVIKAESNKTIVLDLVASSEKVNVKINDKAVKFVKDEEASSYHATYSMIIVANQEYIITLTSSSKVAYKLSVETAQAVEEKAEEVTEEEVVEDTEEETTEEPAEETEEETVETTEEVEEEATEEEPAEETEEETVETTEEVEEEATEEELAEEIEEETVETSEEVEEEETEEESVEETKEEVVEEPVEEKIEENASEEEGIEDSSDEYNTVVETTEEEAVPAMVGWVVADADAYVIGETATLTANSKAELNNQVTWQIKVGDSDWTNAGYGETLAVVLTDENANNIYRFRMEDGNFSDEIQLIVASAQAEETVEEVSEEEMTGEQTEVEEEVVEETEVVEEDTVRMASLPGGKELLDVGYCQVIIITEDGTYIYSDADRTSDIVGYVTNGTEAWVLMNDDESWGKAYSNDGSAWFISMNDAVVIARPAEPDEEIERNIEVTITLDNDIALYGEYAHFKATLTGYESLNYIIHWERSLDQVNWEIIEGVVGETMDVEITEENCAYLWRANVEVLGEAVQP